jgi:hypothetical protein
VVESPCHAWFAVVASIVLGWFKSPPVMHGLHEMISR